MGQVGLVNSTLNSNRVLDDVIVKNILKKLESGQTLNFNADWKYGFETIGFGDVTGNLEDLAAHSGPISFDFWDTLIGRNRPAEGVKRNTALKISLNEWAKTQNNKRIDAQALHQLRIESESKLVSKYGEANLRKALEISTAEAGINISQEELESYVASEIESEKMHTSGFKNFIDLLPHLRSEEKFIISDHYMSSANLLAIANFNQLFIKDFKIIVSSEYGKTKRDNGKLFSEAGLADKANWIHVGDNQYSDIRAASDKGARPILIKRTNTTSWNEHELDIKLLAKDLKKAHYASDSAEYLLFLSTICYGLITFAIEKAVEKSKSKIVYLSREGATLSEAHSILESLLPKRNIEFTYLPISRAASVFSSFNGDTASALDSIEKQYPFISGHALCETMALEDNLRIKLLREIPPYQRIQTSKVLRKIPKELQVEISKYHQQQFALLRELLSQNKIDPENSIVCDLGWRGTINDAMSRISGQEFTGVYLGLLAPWNRNNEFTSKFGMLFDETRATNSVEFLNFFGPLERVFNLKSNQVKSYVDKNSEIYPNYVTASDGPSEERSEIFEKHFEEVLTAVYTDLNSIGLFGYESAPFLLEFIKNWYRNPSAVAAEIWFGESHREGFGVTGDVNYSHSSESLLNLRTLNEFNFLAQKSGWPEGFLAWVINSLKGNHN